MQLVRKTKDLQVAIIDLCVLLSSSLILGRLARTLTRQATNFVFGSRSSLSNLLLDSLDVLLILAHVWQNEMIIDGGRALADWVEEPNEEDELEEVVEGDEAEEESSELVDDVEETKDDPIRQPLLIVIFLIGLEGEERHEAGVSDAKEARNVCASNSTHDHDDSTDDTVAENLLRRETSQFGNFVHDVLEGVFRK